MTMLKRLKRVVKRPKRQRKRPKGHNQAYGETTNRCKRLMLIKTTKGHNQATKKATQTTKARSQTTKAT